MRRITILFLLLSILCQAQIKTFDIPTPTASELARYSDVPVSYYTGKADINIPLYSLTQKGINLPITLNYNASGVLVNTLPGWLGDNWSVSAGGLITRIVQGVCDEIESHPYDGCYENEGQQLFFEHGMYVKNNYFKSCSLLPQVADFSSGASNFALKDSLLQCKCDIAPDIFYFNFMGKTGRFFLGNDGQWKVFSDDNLEVIFDYNNSSNYINPLFEHFPNSRVPFNQPKTIKGFVIRDENGTEYHFGGSTDYIEYSIPFFRQSSNELCQYWTANSWYLNKIVDCKGNIVFQFNYTRGKYIAQLYNSAYNCQYKCVLDATGNHIYDESSSNLGIVPPYDGVLNAPIYLTRITLSDGRYLSFASSDLGVSMQQIYASLFSRYNGTSNVYGALIGLAYYQFDPDSSLGTYPFYYLQSDDANVTAYQYNPNSTEKLSNPLVSTRLRKLDDITFHSSNGTVINSKYLFYYSTSGRIRLTSVRQAATQGSASSALWQLHYYDGLDCDYISTATDHWGYYNANTITDYPTDETGYAAYKTAKNANPAYASAGLLSEIIYPTGGKTVFSYESHQHTTCASLDRSYMDYMSGIAGGARIKKITNYDKDGSLQTERTFTYNLQGNSSFSSGQLFAQPIYFWDNWESDNINIYANTRSVIKMFKSSSIIPLSNKFGPHVGYSAVRETFQDGSYTVYEYTNLSSSLDSPAALTFSHEGLSPYDVYTERDYKRGRILSAKTYANNDLPKKTINYYYRIDPVENNYVWTSSLRISNFKGNPYKTVNANYSHFTGGIYKLFYPKYDIRQVSISTYNAGGIVSENIVYNRMDYSQPVSYGSYTHQVDFRKLMNETKSVADRSVVTSYTYPFSSGVDLATRQLFSQHFFMQPISVTKSSQNQIISKTATKYSTYNSLILPSCEIEYNGSTTDTLLTYNSYTATGAVSQYRKRGEGITNLSWGCNDNCLLSKTTGTHVTSYTYDSNTLNLIRITQPNGNYETYSYDGMGRLSAVRDKNGNLKKSITYNYINN